MAKNPFSNASTRSGDGEIHLALLPPVTPSFRTLRYTYPLKLVSSTPHTLPPTSSAAASDGTRSTRPSFVPLVFLLTYGGGLLPPDSISVKITLEPHTRLTLTTQGSTKIFPSPPREPDASSTQHAFLPHVATQDLDVKLCAGSALLLSPDPSQPFKDSNYSQTQIFEVEDGASLGLLDWVTSGRPARGEIWEAASWKGRNEIWKLLPPASDSQKPRRKLLLRDNLLLTGGSKGVGQSSLKAEGYGVFGTLILFGPVFEAMGTFFVDEFASMPRVGGRDWGDRDGPPKNLAGGLDAYSDDDADQQRKKAQELLAWRKERVAREHTDGISWTAARVRGLVLVKFAARDVEGGREWLGDMCRRQGSIGIEFGPGGLMSLR